MLDSLVGITAGDWLQVVKENKFKIAPSHFLAAAFVTYLSVQNSFRQRKEIKLYGKSVKEVKINKAPIFLLGHWRSGTTFLHNLISLDEQFAFPNFFDIRNPHSLFIKDKVLQKKIDNIGSQKRAMDNIQISLLSPSEEEFAIAILCFKSPLIGWMFPKQAEYYDRYLTFKDVSDEEIEKWKKAFLLFLKKLTLKYNKQLLLKSPANTGRIRLLLEMFPESKFVHIHRNPYNLFKSTKKLYKTAIKASQFHAPDSEEVDDYILGRYKEMYDAFFAEKDLIPKDNFIEVAFEDLETQPLGLIEKIYKNLSVEGFDDLKPKLDEYLTAQSDYKKNKYNDMDKTLYAKIRKEWGRNFEEWGYNN